MRKENWDQIRYFLTVAETGGLTAASVELKTSPSTISRHIEDLESAIGLVLFTRDRSGYQLTGAGKRLFEHAKNVSADAQAFFDSASSADGRARGAVRIATTENFANYILIPQLGPFLQHNPDLSIELLTGMTTINVSRQEAEIAIRNARPDAGNVVIKRLGIQAFCRYRSIDATVDDRTVGWVSERQGFPVPGAIARSDGDTQTQLFTSSLYSQVVAARASIGAAVLPCFVGDMDPSLVRDSDLLEDLQQDIWLVYHADLSHSIRVRTTLEFLSNLVAENRDLIEGTSPLYP
ncbi:LysR family transcriptional regulator [Leisingera sp.]|uniref:LysR family transcriptional regulator n=1 Tax=Leisingera sp. TaxID=1879318 RepID=UPI003A8DE89F